MIWSRTMRLIFSSILFLGVVGILALVGTGRVHAADSCSKNSAASCKDQASCEASGNLYQAGLCHQTAIVNPSANTGVKPVSGPCGKPTFFGLVPWYKYLDYQTNPQTHTCEIVNFNALGNGSNSGILLIVLAIIDDLLRIAGMVAVVFVIVAGFKIMTAQGEPEKVASGRKTLVFALVGLAIAILAVTIVSFIGKAIGS